MTIPRRGLFVNRTRRTIASLSFATAAVCTVLLCAVLPFALISVTAPPPTLNVKAAPVIDYEGCFFHGSPDHQHVEASGRAFPTRSIPYWIDRASTGDGYAAIARAVRWAWMPWAERLDIEPAEVDSEGAALVRIRFGPIDGPSGILAQSTLSDGTGRPVSQKYDSAENWIDGTPSAGFVSMSIVACHELGHALGLGHDDAGADAILRPQYTARIPRATERDISRAVSIGYQRRPAPTTSDPLLSFPVQAKASDVSDALKRAGWRVDRP